MCSRGIQINGFTNSRSDNGMDSYKNYGQFSGPAQFVANMMDKIPGGLIMIIPAMFFLVSCALGFARLAHRGDFRNTNSYSTCSNCE